MRNTARTEQEVADQLKFASVQSMRSFCKTRCGMNPSQLREQ